MRVKRTEKKLGTFFFLFVCFHFQETTETFKGSTKMKISTGKNLKSDREKIGKSKFALSPPPEFFSCYATACLCMISMLNHRDINSRNRNKQSYTPYVG